MCETNNKNCADGQNCACTSSWKSPRFVIIILGMILLSAVITVAILRDRFVDQQIRSVTVVGQGKIAYKPDIAIVTLGVQIDKLAKPEDALSQLNTKVASVVNAVKASGISEENIQVQNYTLYPQSDYINGYLSSGYSANQQLVVKILDYDKNPNKLNALITAASKAGANQVNNFSFDASNMNDLKQAARIKAIEDAKGKSEALAKTAGVKLDGVISWSENLISPVSNPAPMNMMNGTGGGVSVSVTPAGEHDVIMEVGVTYNIK